MDPDTLKILGSGGLVGALLALIWVVGNRLVGAIDRIGAKVDHHTESDLSAHAALRDDVMASHGELREEVVKLRAEVGAVMRMPPSDSEPPPMKRGGTPIRGIPVERSMPYHIRKPTEGK